MQDKNRLKLYIAQCHVDKPLLTPPPVSVFDCPIQAGAALTDIRVCAINDMDDCEDNISDRNRRYSEATAMYWIYKHLDTPYVGISHYRRRLKISDEQYCELMDQNVDIITSIPIEVPGSIEDHYRSFHYGADWELFLKILASTNKEYSDFAINCFREKLFHPCNIYVFKSGLYKEFGDMAFPICDEFYKRSHPKTNVFQHRDVGYIMERLSHLFIMYNKYLEKQIVEVPLIEYSSKDWSPKDECDLLDADKVYEACNRLFCINQITKCKNLLSEAISSGLELNNRLNILSHVFIAAQNEQKNLPQTMFEYLPVHFRDNLDILTDIWSGFEKTVGIYLANQSEANLNKLNEYIHLTSFSDTALKIAMAYIYENMNQ